MKRAKVRRQLVAALATMLPADEEVVEVGRAWMADRRPGVPLAFTGRAPYLAAVTDRRLVVFDRPRRGRPVLEADLRFARRFAVLELGSVRRWTPLMQVRVKLPDDDREVVIELRPRDRPLGRALVSAFGGAVAPAPGAVPSGTPGREATATRAPDHRQDVPDANRESRDLDPAAGEAGRAAVAEEGRSRPGEPIPPEGGTDGPEPAGRGAGAPGTGAELPGTAPPAPPGPRPPADTPPRTRPLPPNPPGWAATPGWSITPGWSMTPGWSATPGLAATPDRAAPRGWPAPAPPPPTAPAPPPSRERAHHPPGPGPEAGPATAGPEDARR